MAKFMTGMLLGLVLGLYLDSAASGGSGHIFSQIQAALANLLLFWR